MQFEICRIPGDGSCLFRALAQGVHQLETGETPDPFAWISFLADARQCSLLHSYWKTQGVGDMGALGIRPG